MVVDLEIKHHTQLHQPLHWTSFNNHSNNSNNYSNKRIMKNFHLSFPFLLVCSSQFLVIFAFRFFLKSVVWSDNKAIHSRIFDLLVFMYIIYLSSKREKQWKAQFVYVYHTHTQNLSLSYFLLMLFVIIFFSSSFFLCIFFSIWPENNINEQINSNGIIFYLDYYSDLQVIFFLF